MLKRFFYLKRWLGLSLVWLLLGHAQGATEERTRAVETMPDPVMERAQPLEGEAASGMKVRLWLDGRPDGEHWKLLKQGGSLRSGEALRMRVNLTHSAYVYVVQFFSDNTARVLYPPEGERHRQLPAGVEVLLPDPGKVFILDEQPGMEHIYVIASRKPLEEVDANLVEAFEVLQFSTRAETGGKLPQDAPPVQGTAETKPGETDNTTSSTSGTSGTSGTPVTSGTSGTSGTHGTTATPVTTDAKPNEAEKGKPQKEELSTKPPEGKKQKKGEPPGVPARKEKPSLVAMLSGPARAQALMDMNTRGVMLADDMRTSEATLVYAADKDGVAVMHVTLRHLP
ncbi:MAG: DUF4384 domain-containing protein [Myxococcota bacterium]